MKVIVVKNNLKNALDIVGRAIGDGSHLAVLKNFLFEVLDSKIKISSTNLEIGIHCTASGKIIEKGAISIPAATLTSIVNNLNSERINLDAKEGSMRITTDNFEASIQGAPHDDYPIIPTVKNDAGDLILPGGFFKEGLSQVIHATQFSELRPELHSVLYDFSLDSLKLVATDGFRLAEKTIPKTKLASTITTPFKILVPFKTNQEVLRILGDDESVTIRHDAQQVLFKTDNWELVSRTIDGNFPEYGSIIPKEFSSEIVIQKNDFMNGLKLAGVFGARANEVKIKVLPNKKGIEISARDQILGENKYTMSAKVAGDVREANFNWNYLLDGLKAIYTEDVYIGFSDENKPALIKAPNDTTYFYIVMPVVKP